MAFYSEISKANSEHTITDVGYKYSLDYLQLTIPEVNLITVSYPKHLQKYTSSQHGPRLRQKKGHESHRTSAVSCPPHLPFWDQGCRGQVPLMDFREP